MRVSGVQTEGAEVKRLGHRNGLDCRIGTRPLSLEHNLLGRK